jgi:hypothetical protein
MPLQPVIGFFLVLPLSREHRAPIPALCNDSGPAEDQHRHQVKQRSQQSNRQKKTLATASSPRQAHRCRQAVENTRDMLSFCPKETEKEKA